MRRPRKFEKIDHFVLTLLSNRFFFQNLWPSHNIWTLVQNFKFILKNSLDPLWKCYGGKLFMKLICKIDALTFAFAACDVIRWEALRFLFYFLHLVARKSRWVEIISDGEYWFSSDDFHKTSTVAIFCTLDELSLTMSWIGFFW